MIAQPDSDQQVTLDVVGQGRIPARVEQGADGHLSLALFVVGEGAGVADEDGAVLEFTSRRGLHRVEGSLRRTPDPERLDFEPRHEPELVQRRTFARVDASVPLTVRMGDHEVHLQTLNVSGNGMLIYSAHGIDVNEEFWFELELEAGAPPLSGRATVVRRHESGRHGVAIDLSARGRDRLARYVADRLRDERRAPA